MQVLAAQQREGRETIDILCCSSMQHKAFVMIVSRA